MFLASSGSSLVDYDSDFSISLWFNVSSWATETSTDFLWTGGGTRIINMTLTGSTGLQVDIWNSGSNLVSTTGLSENTWYHLVFTRSKASGMKLYIDGSLVDTNLYVSNAGSLSGKQDSIGTYWDNTRNNFTGKIDQFRIYDGVVTDDDVTALYEETASQNDDLTLGGPPQTIVSANSNAGFSIVKFKKKLGSSVAEQIHHGLSAAPNMILLKRTDGTEDWYVYHTSLGNAARVQLNSSAAQTTGTNVWGQTNPSATVFTVESFNAGNAIAYCFHDVSGYQKFGSYNGNGTTQSITTGFKPDFVIVKRSAGGTGNWNVYDSRRVQPMLRANTNETEFSGLRLSFESNGFKMEDGDADRNASGSTYIYWAVAKNVPSNTTLANSFKTVTYTGNGGTQSITAVGFKPDLVWIKQRSGTQVPIWYDSNRGVGNYIFSSGTDAQGYSAGTLTSFDSDGFSVSSSNSENQNSQTFVAWAWKAGNTWQSNIDGTIGSIVNANTANGFSIVKYTGDGSTSKTVGHGLSSAPEMVMVKRLDSSADWYVWATPVMSITGSTSDYIVLNSNAAKVTAASVTNLWGGNVPSATTIGVGDSSGSNASGGEYIAYCWHSVSGYSKIGSYSGSGSNDNAISLGFQPDFVMVKRTNSTGGWLMFDSVRSGSNPINDRIEANNNQAEQTNSGDKWLNFNSTDFEANGSDTELNASGSTYIYMAFKAN